MTSGGVIHTHGYIPGTGTLANLTTGGTSSTILTRNLLHDRMGRLFGIATANGSGTVLSRHGYTLDQAGRRVKATRENGQRWDSGGTDNHLIMVDLRGRGLNGAEASHALDLAGITVNMNAIPFDTGTPMKPSGIRIGTPAVTTRGMKEADIEQVADFIHEALAVHTDEAALAAIRERVFAFNRAFPLPY